MDIASIFKYLETFKNFPTYQFERRIDAFLLPYLEKAINQRFNLNDLDLLFVYPEFPLKRLNNTEDKNQKLSDSADYLLWSKKLNTVYLVELKTEIKSIHETQFQTYLFNCQKGWKDLIEYYISKAIGNGSNWRKFVNGILHIGAKAPDLIGREFKTDLAKYLSKPKGVHDHLKGLKKSINFHITPKIQFLYIAPKKANSKLDEFVKNNKVSQDFYIGMLSLEDFAKYTDVSLRDLLINIEKAQIDLIDESKIK
jgi:hypothetical protein